MDIIKKYQKYLAAVGILVLGFLAYSKFNKKKEIVSEATVEQNVSADQQKSTTDEAVSFDTQVEDQTKEDGHKSQTTAGEKSAHADEASSGSAEETDDEADAKDPMAAVFKNFVQTNYRDLFDELHLSSYQEEQMTKQIITHQKNQQELVMMMMDEKYSDEDILSKQEEFMKDHEEKVVGPTLNKNQYDKYMQHTRGLTEKLFSKVTDHQLQALGMDQDEQKEFKDIILEENKKYGKKTGFGIFASSDAARVADPQTIKKVRPLMQSATSQNRDAYKQMMDQQKELNEQIVARAIQKGLPEDKIKQFQKSRENEMMAFAGGAEE